MLSTCGLYFIFLFIIILYVLLFILHLHHNYSYFICLIEKKQNLITVKFKMFISEPRHENTNESDQYTD